MKKILSILLVTILLSGCAATKEAFKGFIGISTNEIEVFRPQAIVKIVDIGYDACYAKAESILKIMDNVFIYSKSEDLIAVYYVDLNTTSVGVFFKGIDSSHTQIEVSSPSIIAKEIVAQNLFDGFKPPKAKSKVSMKNLK